MSAPPFADRRAAGRALGRALAQRHLARPIVVLALPRGGVPVGAEVARALRAPLDLVLVRKIGAPWQPELAVAAVVEGDPPDVVVDEAVRAASGVDRDWIDRQAAVESREIERRRRVYRAGRELGPLGGATVVLVDEPGIARSHREAPEIDGVVLVPDELEVGAFHTVVITGAEGPDLHAEPARPDPVGT